MMEQQPELVVRVADLASRPGVSIDGPKSLWEESTLFRGAFWNRELRRGLFVHGSDVMEDQGFTALSSQHAGLSCVFFLKGDVEVRIGDRDLRFQGDGVLRKALIIPSARAESFRRRSLGRQRIKHLVVSVTPEWLERDGIENAGDSRRASSMTSDHLASRAWDVGPRVAGLVDHLIASSVSSSRIGELHAESAAVAILAEALQALTGHGEETPATLLTAHDRARLARAAEFILASCHTWPAVEKIASQAGVSASSLQRLFRAAYGVSVFEFVRRAKLDVARKQLAAGECSIQEAAAIAGYSNAANFTTAFRRQFGVTPRRVVVR